MKIAGRLLVLSFFFVFTMCGTRKAVSVAPPSPSPSDLGYTGRAEPIFYWTEGILAHVLYGDSRSAGVLFDKAIQADSSNSFPYYAAANNYAIPDPAKALEYSVKANQLDSTNIWYKAQLARLQVMNGMYNEALLSYRTLVDESPHDPDNYRMLAALYEYSNLPFSALSVLDSAEYKLGKLPELATFKRELLIKVKLYDKAIAETRAMVDASPYDHRNYLMLAELYAVTNKDSLARANFERALELSPESTDVLMGLNEYYKNKNDIINYLSSSKKLFLNSELTVDSKLQFFRDLTRSRDFYEENYFQISDLAATLLTMYPDNAEVVDLYGTNLIAGGSLEEALRIYKGYMAEFKPDRSIFNNILQIESYLDRPDSVKKYTRLALQRYPDDSELMLAYGFALYNMKETDAAVDVFNKIIKTSGSDSISSVIHGILGDIYHEQDNSRKSFSSYEKSLKLDPDNNVVLNNYAYYLSLQKKDLDKALAMSEKAVALSAGNSTYLDTYGWVLFQLGRYEEARKILQQAVSLDRTGSKELFIHYGDVLYELGEDFMARIYWRKAKEAGYDQQEIDLRLNKPSKK